MNLTSPVSSFGTWKRVKANGSNAPLINIELCKSHSHRLEMCLDLILKGIVSSSISTQKPNSEISTDYLIGLSKTQISSLLFSPLIHSLNS